MRITVIMLNINRMRLANDMTFRRQNIDKDIPVVSVIPSCYQTGDNIPSALIKRLDIISLKCKINTLLFTTWY